jgi:hypothetical protein
LIRILYWTNAAITSQTSQSSVLLQFQTIHQGTAYQSSSWPGRASTEWSSRFPLPTLPRVLEQRESGDLTAKREAESRSERPETEPRSKRLPTLPRVLEQGEVTKLETEPRSKRPETEPLA